MMGSLTTGYMGLHRELVCETKPLLCVIYPRYEGNIIRENRGAHEDSLLILSELSGPTEPPPLAKNYPLDDFLLDGGSKSQAVLLNYANIA